MFVCFDAFRASQFSVVSFLCFFTVCLLKEDFAGDSSMEYCVRKIFIEKGTTSLYLALPIILSSAVLTISFLPPSPAFLLLF